MTLDFEDFERFYGYKINPSYFRRLQALNHWMGNPASGEESKPLFERISFLTMEAFETYMYKVWHPTSVPAQDPKQGTVPQQVTTTIIQPAAQVASTGTIPTPIARVNSKQMSLLRQ